MSLAIVLFRVIKNGEFARDEQHIMTEEETQIMKPHFGQYIVPMDDYIDDFGVRMSKMSFLPAKRKASINYGFQAYPRLDKTVLPNHHYLFTLDEVANYYEEALNHEDYRSNVFFEQILSRFKERKDFVYFDF